MLIDFESMDVDGALKCNFHCVMITPLQAHLADPHHTMACMATQLM